MEQGKVILILCDGMRPDALEQVAPPLYRHIRREGAWAMDARSVMPPVTLPAHVSLMQSVDPQRHGILTNTYTPQSRPIEGLFDQLHREGKTCAFFYNWDELRDLSRPGSLNWYGFSSGVEGGFEKTDEESLAAARASLPLPRRPRRSGPRNRLDDGAVPQIGCRLLGPDHRPVQ